MVKPLLTVRDFRTELSNEVADAGELLRNYEFNISQGIVQRVSRFFDALALMDKAPPARGEGGKYADSARGGVMGFGRKRNVCNQEKSTQDTKVAALEVQVAELQALAIPSAALIYLCGAPYLSALYTHTLSTMFFIRPPAHLHHICRRRSSGRRSVKC